MKLLSRRKGLSPDVRVIGNLAHELAIANGSHAYGLYVLGFGGYTKWADAPVWMKPFLPATKPKGSALIDLAALRPLVSQYTKSMPDDQCGQLRDLIRGIVALVLLPGSAKASWKLTEFPQP